MNKIKYLVIPMLFIFSSAKAASFDCEDLNSAKLNLSVHTMNFANARTTRTPEGGAFKAKVLVRKSGGGFEIQSQNFTKQVYEPGHPDGDVNGMVTYPNLDESRERQEVTAAARTIELLTTEKICGASNIKKGNSLMVKYKDDKFTTSDFFIFKKNGELESWTNYPTSGGVYTAKF